LMLMKTIMSLEIDKTYQIFYFQWVSINAPFYKVLDRYDSGTLIDTH
jgi:hypothetical protein